MVLQSYHGSWRFSDNGDDPQKTADRRRAMIWGTVATVVGFVAIVALGYLWVGKPLQTSSLALCCQRLSTACTGNRVQSTGGARTGIRWRRL